MNVCSNMELILTTFQCFEATTGATTSLNGENIAECVSVTKIT